MVNFTFMILLLPMNISINMMVKVGSNALNIFPLFKICVPAATDQFGLSYLALERNTLKM